MIKLLATGFYSGLFPKAPGTMGSFVSLFFIILTKYFFPQPWDIYYLAITLAIILMGIPICSYAEKMIFKKEDPKEVVIDEFAGMYVACTSINMVSMSVNVLFLFALAFGVFRFFDILKPFPISFFDAMGGGFGIMMDDVAAGLFSLLIVTLGQYLL